MSRPIQVSIVFHSQNSHNWQSTNRFSSFIFHWQVPCRFCNPPSILWRRTFIIYGPILSNATYDPLSTGIQQDPFFISFSTIKLWKIALWMNESTSYEATPVATGSPSSVSWFCPPHDRSLPITATTCQIYRIKNYWDSISVPLASCFIPECKSRGTECWLYIPYFRNNDWLASRF